MSKGFGLEFLSNHLGYQLLSFLLALIIWLGILTQKNSITIAEVQVIFVVDQSYLVKDSVMHKVSVRLEGISSILAKLDRESLVLKVPIDFTSEGLHQVSLPFKGHGWPEGLEIKDINPRSLYVRLEKK